jgi:hypothetical protein
MDIQGQLPRGPEKVEGVDTINHACDKILSAPRYRKNLVSGWTLIVSIWLMIGLITDNSMVHRVSAASDTCPVIEDKILFCKISICLPYENIIKTRHRGQPMIDRINTI